MISCRIYCTFWSGFVHLCFRVGGQGCVYYAEAHPTSYLVMPLASKMSSGCCYRHAFKAHLDGGQKVSVSFNWKKREKTRKSWDAQYVGFLYDFVLRNPRKSQSCLLYVLSALINTLIAQNLRSLSHPQLILPFHHSGGSRLMPVPYNILLLGRICSAQMTTRKLYVTAK